MKIKFKPDPNSKYLAIAETKLGFEKCTPYAEFGDCSFRWLHTGGGLWDSNDVVGFVKHKITLDRSLAS